MESIGTPRQYGVAVGEGFPRVVTELLHQVSGETSLAQMDIHLRRGKGPREMDTKKLLNQSHKVNLQPVLKEVFKECFHLWIFGEIDKVVNIVPN